MATLSTVWKNRRHFQIQIFGIATVLVIAVFCLNLLTIVIKHDKAVDEFHRTNIAYTDSFTMSLSGTKGNLKYVFTNADRTQCFLLLRMNNMDVVSLNANDYQVLITNADFNGKYKGFKKNSGESKMTGDIYVFGSTGFIGIYLESPEAFTNSLKWLTLRCYNSATTNKDSYVRYASSDYEYDQGHIFFNPGAENRLVVDFLENHKPGEPFDPTLIYQQVFTVFEEKTQRQGILDFYTSLNNSMAKISSHYSRLVDTYNVDMGDLPDYVKGDYFKDIEITDAQGNVVHTYNKFMPATVVPGGIEYDWYIGNVIDGYYKNVPNTNGLSINDYLGENVRKNEKAAEIDWEYVDFYFKDGTKVPVGEDNISTYDKSVIDELELYEKAIDEYLELKTTYQQVQLPDLLRLERDSTSAISFYSVNNSTEGRVMPY